MPSSWRSKDERQYEHIRESQLERGVGEDRAKEIAARTVNRQRRQEGQTSSRRRSGSNSSTTTADRRLEDRSREELLNLAQQLRISGRSSMNKAQLSHAIRQKNG